MISIIVPVYNVEDYLPRCVDSILAQSYQDFEILLIDDGSGDRSTEICDDYAGRDDRVRVFHKENGGLSDARNYGLDRMRGELVTFIDSDDYVGVNYLEILYDMMQNADIDVAEVSMIHTYSRDAEYVPSADQRDVLEGNDAFLEMIRGERITWSACAKLYKSGLFGAVRFPKGRCFEDLLTIPYIVGLRSRFARSTSIQYYYYQREGSIMNGVSDERIQTWLSAMDQLENYIHENIPRYDRCYQAIFVKGVFWRVIDWRLDSEDYKVIAGEIRRDNRALFRNSMWLPLLNAKERIKGFIFYLSIYLYRFVRKGWIKALDNPDNRHYIARK